MRHSSRASVWSASRRCTLSARTAALRAVHHATLASRRPHPRRRQPKRTSDAGVARAAVSAFPVMLLPRSRPMTLTLSKKATSVAHNHCRAARRDVGPAGAAEGLHVRILQTIRSHQHVTAPAGMASAVNKTTTATVNGEPRRHETAPTRSVGLRTWGASDASGGRKRQGEFFIWTAAVVKGKVAMDDHFSFFLTTLSH